ncbi:MULTISPECIES: hypothetical protein [Flavobacterium]|uniref:hypothetical protein n=1 Tax=Flavobacterium TaxID=237 RepID=UPI0011A17E6D|nr:MULTISPECIES: hypothetical protein [Flavobacterium]
MENKLEIKYRNQKQSFEILEDEIIVDLDTPKHKLKYNIPLEEIKTTQYINKTKEDSTSMLLNFSLFLNLSFILYLVVDNFKLSPVLVQSIFLTTSLAFVAVMKFFFDGHDEKHIDSSKLFYFIYTKKNAEEVDDYIELVYKKQIDFFRKKYFLIDPVLPYGVQNERYIWLYSNKYINENEYEVIKEDLDKYFSFNPTL